MAVEKQNRIVLEKHHKFVIGGISAIVIISLIIIGILLNILLTRQNLNYNELNNKIDELQMDTQSKLNELTTSLITTNDDVKALNSKFGTINQEFNELKASTSSDFSGIIEDVVTGVVTVRTDVGQGTGFIITDSGYIVTNAHVLSGGREIKIITNEQKIINANLIGYNGNLDIALLKISGEYNSLTLADSDNLQIGEKVIAIGNPLGLQFSVSEGIVSGIHRTGPNGMNIYIQTDAALNPG
ncbi:MAG: trypsin-like peptidase domain-containing protein, partial [Nanoarchaeota archaeon]